MFSGPRQLAPRLTSAPALTVVPGEKCGSIGLVTFEFAVLSSGVCKRRGRAQARPRRNSTTEGNVEQKIVVFTL